MRAAAEVMTDQGVGALVVLGREGLVGIVSESDVVWALAGGADADKACVADRMTEYPVCADSDEPVIDVARTMTRLGIDHLPVLREGQPVGMTSRGDVLEVVVGC